MNELRIVPRALGGSPMVRDGNIAATATEWYPNRPSTGDAWRQHAEEVRASVAVDWLDRLAPAFGATGSAALRLSRSASGRGVVVTTGQQPGLFGGPLYTWWKALSALAFADAIERTTGIPAAPVFWAATDDSDFAEASTTYVAVRGGLERVALPPADVHGVRLADVSIGDAAPLLARLAAGAGASVYPAAFDVAADAYRESSTIGSAYVSLLRAVLEPLGVAVLDAANPLVRQAGNPVARAALREAASIEQALAAREGALRSAGYRPQVPLVRGRSLVFAHRNGVRERVPIGRSATPSAAEDETLAPNVLLRPIVERSILPTAAYLAGPGELAYFAQVSAVAHVLATPVPLPLPRWSGTIIEPHVQRLFDRYGLDIAGLQDPHAAEGAVAREALPAEVRDALGRLRGMTSSALDALAHALREAGSPSVPPGVLAGALRENDRRASRLERRLVAAAKREQIEAMTDLATLRAAVVPAGKPQERLLNLLPLLARHGPPLLDAVLAAARQHAKGLVERATAQRVPAS
ncbi:MAG TPA: bacillithiol biosynthesis BshC [Gemmatimonadaceae bacterium]|nr:bacillithiol biosynthesis BshC [Gemmatimonadaceae bacterium]